MRTKKLTTLGLSVALALIVSYLESLLPPLGIFTLGELIYIRAQVMARAGEEKDALLLRALRLMCMVGGEEPLCVARCARLRELMDQCADQLTAEDYIRCARFFMAGEHFDDGEDAIFLAVEEAEEPDEYIRRGLDLLRGLLALPDSTLTPGGLPKEDVRRAIDDLQAWGTA